MALKYYLLIEDERTGPIAREDLLQAGMRWDTLVWSKGQKDWQLASEIPELQDLLDELPPPPKRKSRDRSLFALDNRPYITESDLERPCSLGRRAFSVTNISLGIGLLFCLLAFVIDYSIVRNRDLQWIQTSAILAAIICGVVSVVSLLIAGICLLKLLYRAWSLIQDGQAKTSPGAAVGLMFVPIFQFYWVFVTTSGLARELNRFADRHRLIAPRAPVVLGTSIGIYYVFSAIPFLGLGAFLLNLFLLPTFMRYIYESARSFCDENIQRIPDEQPELIPHSAFTATVAGISATLLGYVGLTSLILGSLFVPAKWYEYQSNTERLASMKQQLAANEARPPNQLGIRGNQELQMQRTNATYLEQAAIPRTWSQFIVFSIVGCLGMFLSPAALFLAFFASRSATITPQNSPRL